jgi:circadian clock protein KaiC
MKDIERIKSGVPRLDYILKGGFLRCGMFSIVGPPGSGKTILGNQICFNHIAHTGEKCLFINLLSENVGKMFGHLDTLSFFKRDIIPEKIQYLSGYSTLKQEGSQGLLALIQKLLKEYKSSLLVLDGAHAIARFLPEQVHLDEFLNELQVITSLHNCTTILLSPGRYDERKPEYIIVDGLIELTHHLEGPRAVRELIVHKFRGTDFLLGKHEVEITAKGVQIHPRTEIQYAEAYENKKHFHFRMKFGVKNLDEMLGGGLVSGSTALLVGPPATGKTLLGLSFLVEGAKAGCKSMYFGFYEPPHRMIEKAERVGIPLKQYVDQGLIEILWQAPLEHYLDSLAEEILEKVRKEKSGKTRLFIDGVEGFRVAAIYKDRLPRFLSAFTNQLRRYEVTTVMADHFKAGSSTLYPYDTDLGAVVDGVIVVDDKFVLAQRHKLISILKMRESVYDTSTHEFYIHDNGLEVEKTSESAERLLTIEKTSLHSLKQDVWS